MTSHRKHQMLRGNISAQSRDYFVLWIAVFLWHVESFLLVQKHIGLIMENKDPSVFLPPFLSGEKLKPFNRLHLVDTFNASDGKAAAGSPANSSTSSKVK
ncbi:hypothetical protein STEG23_015806 [Scotinomys teguina]